MIKCTLPTLLLFEAEHSEVSNFVEQYRPVRSFLVASSFRSFPVVL